MMRNIWLQDRLWFAVLVDAAAWPWAAVCVYVAMVVFMVEPWSHGAT